MLKEGSDEAAPDGDAPEARERSPVNTPDDPRACALMAPPDAAWSRTAALLALGLAVVAAAVYSFNLSGVWIYDDIPAISGNMSIRSLQNLALVLQPPNDLPVSGRPITNLSLAIDFAIWQHNPFGYKLHNLVLHILSAWLLLGVVRRAMSQPGLRRRFGMRPELFAFGVALVWIIHPMLGEVIVYATQRTEALASMFMLLVFYAAVRGWSSSRPTPWLVLAAAAHLLGLGSKEIVVTTIPLLLLFDRAFVSGSFKGALSAHRWWYIALACTLALLLYTYRSNPRPESTGLSHGVSVLDYLLTQSNVLVYYIWSTFWPSHLSPVHDWEIVKDWRLALASGPAILLLLGATAWCLWRYPKLGFLGCWFFFILAPTSSFIPIVTEVASDRRMYLPSLAIIAIVAAALLALIEAACRRLSLKQRSATAAWLALVVVMSSALIVRNVAYLGSFESTLALSRAMIEIYPQSARANASYGQAIATTGDIEGALPYAKAAVVSGGLTRQVVVSFVSSVYLALGDAQRAEYLERRVYRVNPEHPEADRRLARALNLVGKTGEAIEVLQASLQEKFSYPAACELADMLVTQGRPAAAIATLEDAQQKSPDTYSVLYRLGSTLNLVGRHDEAIAPLQQAVDLDPTSSEAWQQLGAAYAESGRFEQAAAAFRRVVTLSPDHPYARDNLADVERQLRASQQGS